MASRSRPTLDAAARPNLKSPRRSRPRNPPSLLEDTQGRIYLTGRPDAQSANTGRADARRRRSARRRVNVF